MDITKSIVKGREDALLLGDYNTYRVALSRRLHTAQKKLGRTSKKNSKFTEKSAVTAEDIGKDREYVRLLFLTSERAWAHAMHMRSSHTSDSKLTSSTRAHIVSRLRKASIYANQLFELCSNQSVAGASDADVLEARAYAATLMGAAEFEKQNSESWRKCVKNYSNARLLYSVLETAEGSDIFKDLLSATIDPSIRYAAHQLGIPRTVPVQEIARQSFLEDYDANLASMVEKLDADVLVDPAVKAKADSSELGSLPQTINWRSRTVELEDASIATALGSVATAARKLSKSLSSSAAVSRKEKASAYDDILIKSQDAVDATKHAIDELVAERIGQSDKRMQSLQITRTFVNYEMISWRIGRNRVLTGEHDGALLGHETIKNIPRGKKGTKPATEKEEGTARRLARLRERVVLYDATLQSLEAIRELPGIAADTIFLAQIEAKRHYFRALKCLSISRSHDLLSQHAKALALLARAVAFSAEALSAKPANDIDLSYPPSINISQSDFRYLHNLLQGELQHQRALVELSNLERKTTSNGGQTLCPPLLERLHEYPATEGGLDLKNLVSYPPKLEPVPVKPLFFDVAWNYIEYPGRSMGQQVAKGSDHVNEKENGSASSQQNAQQKKSWFGFGR